MNKQKKFNLNGLLKQKIRINSQLVSGYFLTNDKTHCLWLGATGLYEFIETGDKNIPFQWMRLK